MLSSTILHLIVAHKLESYLILFLAMLVEGDAFIFISAFLSHYHVLSLPYIIPIVYCGTILGDFLWYSLGRWLSPTGRIAHWAERLTKRFNRHITDQTTRTIFITKFMYGIHRATLVRAGMLQVPFRKFIQADIIASVLWITIIGGLGLFAGSSIHIIRHYLKFAEFALVFGLVTFILVEHIVSFTFKKVIIDEDKKY